MPGDKKISEFDELFDVTGLDVLPILDRTGASSYVNKKVTINNLLNNVAANTNHNAHVKVNSGGSLTVIGDLRVQSTRPTPPNGAQTVIKGLLFFDANYIYVATANNTLKRVALSSF